MTLAELRPARGVGAPRGPADAGERLPAPSARARRWRERFRRLRIPLDLWVGGALLAFFGAAALAALVTFGPAVGGYASEAAWVNVRVPPGPSTAHPFGVMNDLGVDTLQALWQATPFDLALVGSILLLSAFLGFLFGAAAGLSETGPLDAGITVWSDTIAGVPPWILVIVLFTGLAGTIGLFSYPFVFVLVYALILWPYYARPVRSRAREIAASTFVESARASGARRPRLLVEHVLPNSFTPVLAQIPIDVTNVFFVLAVYPWVGCYFQPGVQGPPPYPPTLYPLPFVRFPEWGFLVSAGACSGWSPIPSLNLWWMYVFPAAAIVVFGIAVAFASDGIAKLLLRRGR